MSWQIINVEPAYGICDQCKRHECGIVDGKHKWVMTGIYDKSGDAIVIGYKCVELWAANLGISREVVEKEVQVKPTEEQLLAFIQRVINGTSSILPRIDNDMLVGETGRQTERKEMKALLTEHNVPFAKNVSDDKLRELVSQHV
jgi:hypothetical protein